MKKKEEQKIVTYMFLLFGVMFLIYGIPQTSIYLGSHYNPLLIIFGIVMFIIAYKISRKGV